MTNRTKNHTRKISLDLVLLGVITLLALILRFWQLGAVPPGWRDDELINSLVISQKVLDGDLALYYADASGHEALYHALNAVFLAAFGPGVPGIRWLSVILGTLTIPLTYLVGRRLFDSLTGLVAAAALAVSFWSLMYSRIGIRHVLTPVLALTTFYFFLRGLGIGRTENRSQYASLVDFFLAALFMGLGFYTYFASRGVPLILLAFCVYLLLFARDIILRHWRGILIMFGLAVLMAIPLLITLSNQPESEARVAELAVPLVEGRLGNFEPLRRHVIVTLSMFHGDGDDEWLYNIPHRPIFGPAGAVFFWTGVIIALVFSLSPFYHILSRKSDTIRSENLAQQPQTASLSSTLLLIWWLAGISPGFISVPPGSLGHTILAQSAVYLLAALPVWWLFNKRLSELRAISILLGLLLIASVAIRDLPDYFQEWPQRGMTRFLYRADIHDVADYLNDNPDIDEFSIAGLLAGPWDKIALSMDLNDDRARIAAPRWYNPQRALLLQPPLSFGGFPDVESPYTDALLPVQGVANMGGYKLYEVQKQSPPSDDEKFSPICFKNNLCWISASYDPQTQQLELGWLVQEQLLLPSVPLISNPPPPGVYSGPRLFVFAQLQDAQGSFLVGDDGLWVDPQTLQPGDQFIQQHNLATADKPLGATAVIGLYDPKTGERIPTTDGQDHIRLKIGE